LIIYTLRLRRLVRRRRPRKQAGKREYAKHKEAARVLVHARLEHFNQHYGFAYNSVAIRNQRTRWGSCSAKHNLNFNYRIVFLPLALQDYLIVHELCHLQEFNHSAKFWALVAETTPDYRALRQALRASGALLR
jgi:predicted metal-dependent hydrolase